MLKPSPQVIHGEYTAGDVRARENPGLASIHTLFVLEHNHIVDLLRSKYPFFRSDSWEIITPQPKGSWVLLALRL